MVLAAVAAPLLGGVREAVACSLPPGGWLPRGISPAAANGVVMLRYSCDSDCEMSPALEGIVLENAEGELVPASLVFTQMGASDIDVGLLPEPGTLAPGDVLTAELEGVPPFEGILIGPEVTWNEAPALAETLHEVEYLAGESRCCAGPIDTCGGTPCFNTELERRTAVHVSRQDETPLERYQYVFRLGREAIDPGAPWSWDMGSIRFEMDAAEDSACYVLELKRLVDGAVQTFGSRCVDRPESFTPGVHPTAAETVARVLAGCSEPPDGYEKAWCDAKAAACESSPDEPWCLTPPAGCSTMGTAGSAGGPSGAGAPGNGGAAGTFSAQGGTSGAPLTGGTTSLPAGAGGTAEGGASDGESGEAGDGGGGKRVYTKGCGCTLPGDGSGEPAAFALALALFALRSRRSTRRAGRSVD